MIIKHRFSDFKCETGWTSLRPTEKAESDCIKFISHRMKWWQARVQCSFIIENLNLTPKLSEAMRESFQFELFLTTLDMGTSENKRFRQPIFDFLLFEDEFLWGHFKIC